MSDYQLQVLNEHEAFLIGIKLAIRQADGVVECNSTETKDGTIFFIEFQNEDQMFAFDKKMRETTPFLFS